MAKILIVDDSEVVLASLEGMLKKTSHEVLSASSGNQALGILRQQIVDLVILDMFMPAPDGLEVMSMARGLGIKVPFIAMSAKESPLNMFVAARALGAKIALQKPFSSECLLDAVETLLTKQPNPPHAVRRSSTHQTKDGARDTWIRGTGTDGSGKLANGPEGLPTGLPQRSPAPNWSAPDSDPARLPARSSP